MKAIRPLFALLLSALLFVGCGERRTSDMSNPQVAAASALAHRILPAKADRFVFEALPQEAQDYFTLRQEGPQVVIGGNNAGAMAVGLNYYLKYYCHREVGWFVWDTFRMPRRLPRVEEPVKIAARVPHRFFFNYCTYGYTMPWWGWEQWEHVIDWMALNGVNLPLAITGQESVWYKVWTDMGLSPEEVRAYFTGPAHLPWHRMQNIDRWGGPLPESWLEGQEALQKRIVARERELSMKPVLPAFAGHVPRELKRIRPDAPITQLEAWSGYQDEYACSFLDPMSDLYTEIQQKFLAMETELYGTDHIYGIDIFNELMPPSWEPKYLGRVSRQVYESLQKADPEATWLQMGWLFYNERQYWLNDRVKAYLTSFPTEHQLMLDYYCERQEVWQRTEKFFDVPYIWCYLGNFGGNTMLVGDLKTIDERLENTFRAGGDNFCGIGCTLEGFDCNPYIYEYVLEKAWDMPQHRDLDQWRDHLAIRRAGCIDDASQEAWKLLIDSIYTAPSRPGQCPLVNIRPTFGKYRTYYANPRIAYENATLFEVWRLLLASGGRGPAFDFDLANIARQAMSNLFLTEFRAYEAAYEAGDRAVMKTRRERLMGLIDDIDGMTGCCDYFLMGRWIADARTWGKDAAEADYFEQNARNILTTWSDKDMLLNDYASRTWNGLTKTFYGERWRMFFDAVDAALDAGGKFDEEAFSRYHRAVTDFEKVWWEDRVGVFPTAPTGPVRPLAARLYDKYAVMAVPQSAK